MHYKRRSPAKKLSLCLKYWWRGMSKTNYRKQGKRMKFEKSRRWHV